MPKSDETVQRPIVLHLPTQAPPFNSSMELEHSHQEAFNVVVTGCSVRTTQ
jgi:hypothetical protein